MHPEILSQLAVQRGQEMRARARQASLARMAIRGRRHGHRRPDDFAIPAIPDYVDGSFLTEPASTAPAAEQVSGEAPAARHAA